MTKRTRLTKSDENQIAFGIALRWVDFVVECATDEDMIRRNARPGRFSTMLEDATLKIYEHLEGRSYMLSEYKDNAPLVTDAAAKRIVAKAMTDMRGLMADRINDGKISIEQIREWFPAKAS